MEIILEEWRDIPGFEGKFQASMCGQIKSLSREYKTGANYYPRVIPDRIIGGNTLTTKGYKRVNLNNKIYQVHRLIAITWIPNPENKPQINHKDGNKLNNHISNLEWATNIENRNHAVKNNLIAIDTDYPFTKLTQEQVETIRYLYKNEIASQREIAFMFSVVQQTISKICTNKSRNKFRE